MTTEYIPGRIYSGIAEVDGTDKRILMIRNDPALYGYTWEAGVNSYSDERVTDVRGPLVVLDLGDIPISTWAAVHALRAEGTQTGDWLADQIEEQTRPPLQIGWHEAFSQDTGADGVLRWDGSGWYWPSGVASLSDWASTHFIGPAGGES